MNATEKYEVVFPDWYDERGEWEAKEKGWLDGVEVRLADGKIQPLFFYDPVRLAQDLEADSKHGRPFVAQPGMVVLPEITRNAILEVVGKLVDEAYFQTATATSKP